MYLSTSLNYQCRSLYGWKFASEDIWKYSEKFEHLMYVRLQWHTWQTGFRSIRLTLNGSAFSRYVLNCICLETLKLCIFSINSCLLKIFKHITWGARYDNRKISISIKCWWRGFIFGNVFSIQEHHFVYYSYTLNLNFGIRYFRYFDFTKIMLET